MEHVPLATKKVYTAPQFLGIVFVGEHFLTRESWSLELVARYPMSVEKNYAGKVIVTWQDALCIVLKHPQY